VTTMGDARQGAILQRLRGLAASRHSANVCLAAGFVLSFAIPRFGLLDQYVQLILMYVGINIILAASLNLVNGYMGEFSVGHAGFMAVGAYTASMLSIEAFPSGASEWLFPLAVAGGGAGAARGGASCIATEMPKLPIGSSSAVSTSTRTRPGMV